MTSIVSIGDYHQDNFEKLVELFSCHFQAGDKLLSQEYIEWLYLRNPHGTAKIVVVDDDGRWTGFMAMIPIRLISDGEQVVCYYVVNVLVHPEHQGKFLFGKMVSEAKKYIAVGNSVICGHPNALAIKTWQRSKMSFKPELRPYIFLPWWNRGSYTAHEVRSGSQLSELTAISTPYANQERSVAQLVDRDYVQWRFIDHPYLQYRIQLLRHMGQPVGLLISRQIKLQFSLLIDIFVPPVHLSAGIRLFPMGTVAFMSESSERLLPCTALALPWKKRIPFFFSHEGGLDFTGRRVNIGLSASDF
jgi:hypothetical protein